MGSLMIRCPQTGLSIFTGIETDQISLDKTPDVPTHTRCSVCGREHMWWKRETWLTDAPPMRGHTRPTPI
jgi:hypothetical protein